ncbi:hypothetical protein Tco_0237106 [Tanacetum coccineum]
MLMHRRVKGFFDVCNQTAAHISAFDHHVININFDVSAELTRECFIHQPLLGCSSVSKPESHLFIAGSPMLHVESCFFFIFLCHLYPMIPLVCKVDAHTPVPSFFLYHYRIGDPTRKVYLLKDLFFNDFDDFLVDCFIALLNQHALLLPNWKAFATPLLVSVAGLYQSLLSDPGKGNLSPPLFSYFCFPLVHVWLLPQALVLFFERLEDTHFYKVYLLGRWQIHDGIGNFRSDGARTTMKSVVIVLLPFPSQSKRVKGMVITPNGHSTCPTKPIRGDVGNHIDAFASSISFWKQYLDDEGVLTITMLWDGYSLENAISVLFDIASEAMHDTSSDVDLDDEGVLTITMLWDGYSLENAISVLFGSASGIVLGQGTYLSLCLLEVFRFVGTLSPSSMSVSDHAVKGEATKLRMLHYVSLNINGSLHRDIFRHFLGGCSFGQTLGLTAMVLEWGEMVTVGGH